MPHFLFAWELSCLAVKMDKCSGIQNGSRQGSGLDLIVPVRGLPLRRLSCHLRQ